MILASLFGQKSGKQPVEDVYGAIMAAARRPTLYEAFAVPDTIDGRFDMVILHAFAVMERLKDGSPKAQDFSQELADRIFLEMDRAFREMGVGDLAVSKRVRKLAEIFYGRLAAYKAATQLGEAAMAEALSRNVYPDGVSPPELASLTHYAMRLRDGLASQPPEAIAKGEVDFPEAQA